MEAEIGAKKGVEKDAEKLKGKCGGQNGIEMVAEIELGQNVSWNGSRCVNQNKF